MAVYINGKSLNDLFEQHNIKINEIEGTINMTLNNINTKNLFETPYITVLQNLGIEYTNHETIEDWILDLVKFG